jgi:hypothetical protein
MTFPDLLSFLNFYSTKGYQIVFDYSGIRVWYLPVYKAPKLYEGEFMNDAMEAIENHYNQLDEDMK